MVGSTRSKSRRRKVSRVKDATSPIIIHSDSTTSTATNTSKNSNNPNLRILSVNACCLPSGLRNAYLPSDTVRAGFSLHFLFYGIAIGLYQHYYSSTDIQSQFSDSQFLMKIALPLFLFCFLIGWVLGGQAARLIGKVRQQFFGWGSDYKFERLKFLSEEVFPSYDVIAVQELFSSYPNVLDAGHVDCLIGYAKKQGFIHVGRPGRAKFPSFAMNTGFFTVELAEVVAPNVNHEMVIIGDGTEVRVYVDGVESSSVVGTDYPLDLNVSITNFHIGSSMNNISPLKKAFYDSIKAQKRKDYKTCISKTSIALKYSRGYAK